MTIAVVLAAALAATAVNATVTDIRPIALHPGVNVVQGFAPGGRAATIVQAWRGNGNAHSYNTWLVLTPDSEGHPLGVVDEASPSGQNNDLIRDDPFDGERTLGVVRFARAKVNGRPASILIDAYLGETASGVLADHAPATIVIYRLDHTDSGVGSTTDVFAPVATIRPKGRFCNAELALRAGLGLRLSPKYAGPNRIDGCFPD